MTEISLRFEPPFARIILNRPERRNAISPPMWRALPAIRAAIEGREDLLVALVEGEGAHFSAGANIAELGEVYRDAAATRDYGDAVQDGLEALMDLDRPTNSSRASSAPGMRRRLAIGSATRLRWRATILHASATHFSALSSLDAKSSRDVLGVSLARQSTPVNVPQGRTVPGVAPFCRSHRQAGRLFAAPALAPRPFARSVSQAP